MPSSFEIGHTLIESHSTDDEDSQIAKCILNRGQSLECTCCFDMQQLMSQKRTASSPFRVALVSKILQCTQSMSAMCTSELCVVMWALKGMHSMVKTHHKITTWQVLVGS